MHSSLDLLVEAYRDDTRDDETRLHTLIDLRDLARYIGRDDVMALADDDISRTARHWVAEGEPSEQRYRLRTLSSLVSREFADTIRDELAAAG